jgi:ComF family protein
VRQAIHQFKYHHFKALALPLAQLLAQHLETKTFKANVIVPVPLHPHRLRERGYNQSALLARELAKLIELPVEEGQLFRSRDTAPQVMIGNAEHRRSNLIGVFASREKGFLGQNILLIDDVCTTGATLDSAAVALKAAGANLVYGLTLAREV